MTPVLVLFDIDGTLLRSQGTGVGAMQQAFDELYPQAGLSMQGVPIAGRLDTLIWADVLRAGGVQPSNEALATFREVYARILAQRIASGITIRQMPGVARLVRDIADREDAVLGLLTGNWPDTARMKITAAGFDAGLFRFGAFAGDGPDRRSLPPVAMRRFEEELGRSPQVERVVVVGDTPADIDCAKFNGCRALAVATGDYSVEALQAADADWAVPDLGDAARTIDWIFGR